jgi:hypothetical protein
MGGNDRGDHDHLSFKKNPAKYPYVDQYNVHHSSGAYPGMIIPSGLCQIKQFSCLHPTSNSGVCQNLGFLCPWWDLFIQKDNGFTTLQRSYSVAKILNEAKNSHPGLGMPET